MEERELTTRHEDDPSGPGAVLLFAAGTLHFEVFSLSSDPLLIGRGKLGDVELNDNYMSRQHSRVAYDGGQFVVTDCGSRNGTSVDGQPITGTVESERFFLVRAGETLLLLTHDVRVFRQTRVRLTNEWVLGPSTEGAFTSLVGARRAHLSGDVGSGREFAARYLHRHGANCAGPFVVARCAGLGRAAEYALFGGRGHDGHVAQAKGGTLFLDEVNALPVAVQRHLAELLDTGRLASGSEASQSAALQVCSASRAQAEHLLAAGAVVPELMKQLMEVSVRLAPLRQRLEEVPAFIARELQRVPGGLAPHASLIEACLVRPWPGNVRELLMEVRNAAQVAVEAGARDVRAVHLAAAAGMPLATADRFETLEESPAAIARSQRRLGSGGSNVR